MNRIGFVLKVKADKIEEYKMQHRTVWPEMQAALRASGWHNYSLFLREDGLLFGYFESPHDLATASAQMAQTEVNTRWQEKMAPYFESTDNVRPDRMLVELEQVFYLA